MDLMVDCIGTKRFTSPEQTTSNEERDNYLHQRLGIELFSDGKRRVEDPDQLVLYLMQPTVPGNGQYRTRQHKPPHTQCSLPQSSPGQHLAAQRN